MNATNDTAIVLAHCPDTKGLVHAMTDFVLSNNGNIISLNEHVDRTAGHFYVRIEWELTDFLIPHEKIRDYFDTLIAQKFDMSWQLHMTGKVPRLGIFVSKYVHCLYDLLSRYESGEWKVEIPLIISNHEKFAPLARRLDIPFFHLPITRDNKLSQEKEAIRLLQEHRVDLIVLARYMQILSSQLVDAFPRRIINIHHSSLPAFAGANPYKAAFMRGVKFMGATAHYVTEELDEGPIIAQDVFPISHRDSVAEMKRKGRDIEKIVLAKAIWHHINHRVLVHRNRTIVFD